MDIRLLPYNRQLEEAERFGEIDPQLCQLKSHRYVYQFALLDQLPLENPGIYTLCGAHRVGKTTILKSWLEKLLKAGIPAEAIAFFSAEIIEDYHVLHRMMEKQLSIMSRDSTLYVIVDDIAMIRDWAKAIELIANTGMLENVILILSSHDISIKQEVKNKFSDQRRTAKQTDFHLYPLSFRDTVLLKQGDEELSTNLFNEFNHYLHHGGYLDAINEIAIHGHILDKTLITYVEWICKEAVRNGKQERYLREILTSVLKHYNSQVTWNVLAQELSIDHPKTIGDYFSWLEARDIVFVQYALIEETLKPAPKKARKLMFTDPFIFHAVQAWLSSVKNNSEDQIKATLDSPELCSKLVETCVITQFRRYYPTYYIKAEGEIDLAYVHNKRFWPIETTWLCQIRAKDLKQILKYANGRILTKTERSGIIEHIKTEPLPLALWQLEDTNEE